MRDPSPRAAVARVTSEWLEQRVLFAAGELDPTFGQGGQLSVQFPGGEFISVVRDVAVQPDGKIVLAGEAFDVVQGQGASDFAVARLNRDGSPDLSFDGDGVVVFPAEGNADEAAGVAVQADGKIVAAGSFNNNNEAGVSEEALFAVLRFNPDGTRDETWGFGGIVITLLDEDPDATPHALASDVLVGADGKITALGARLNPTTELSDIVLARYNPEDGSLDSTYGNGGTVVGRVRRDSELAVAGIFQPDGKLVVTGSASDVEATEGGFASDFLTARFNTDGSLDTGFGDAGATYSRFPVQARSAQLALAGAINAQPDGRIVVGGFVARAKSETDVSFRVALARLNPDGSPDLSFGKRGVVESNLGQFTSVDQILISDDGRIICGGLAGLTLEDVLAERFNALVVQYGQDGKLDKTFGDGGRVVVRPDAGLLSASARRGGGGGAGQGAGRVDLSNLSLTTALRFNARGIQPAQTGEDFQDVLRRQAAVLVAIEDRILVLSSSNDQLRAAQLIGNGPDLVVGPVILKARPVTAGGKGSASVRVFNNGNAPVAGSTPVTLMLSTDPSLDPADLEAARVALVNNLNPRRRKSVRFRFLYPTDLPAGTYYIVALADPGAADVRPENNAATSTSQVTVL